MQAPEPAPAGITAIDGDAATGAGASAGAASVSASGARSAHEARLQDVRARVTQSATGAADGAAPIGLAKATSNLFRDRLETTAKRAVDLHAFTHVIEIDAAAGWADVEGLTPYERLVDATLAQRRMPAVVPQLKTITIGGAAAGLGIEATSFRHGLVHENLLEFDVLLPDGSIVLCRPDNEHSDLFHGFPNSYGTLGYALRLRTRLLPVQPYVEVRHRRFDDLKAFFEAVAVASAGDADFVDGVMFDPQRLVLTEARFTAEAPRVSDYTFERIYYRSLLERELDWLTVHDYLWRWDTDWFWCSKNLGVQNPLLRRLWGRERLNSRTYTKVMRWNSRHGFTRALSRLRGRRVESVIQDVDIPIDHAVAFARFMFERIGILPIWVCPFRVHGRFDLYPLDPRPLYVNFGFWDTVERPASEWLEPGHFNREIERKVVELHGLKSLYSDSYFEADQFWSLYGADRYWALKRKYDPRGLALDLYQKCVQRH